MPNHTIFNERPESQDRVIKVLERLGYQYIPRSHAENLRGRLSNVLFPEVLREFLHRQSFDLKFIDWEYPENNIWQVSDEFSVERPNGKYARPDIVLLINGIPLVVIECKKSSIDVEEGVAQNIRNWQPNYIPQLFKFAQIVMAMNPNTVKFGTCGTLSEYFNIWREKDYQGKAL